MNWRGRLPSGLLLCALIGLAWTSDVWAQEQESLAGNRNMSFGTDEFGRPTGDMVGGVARQHFANRRARQPEADDLARRMFPTARPLPSVGVTTGTIGPFTTGPLGPFTTFSNTMGRSGRR